MAINKAQAELLASGFLDTIGSDDFTPKDSLTTLIIAAAYLVEQAQKELRNNVSSGALSSSIKALDPKGTRAGIYIDVEMLFYGQFLNAGVRGTRRGSGEYKFKHDMPSRDMVNQISRWLKKAGKSSFNVNAKKSIYKNERKNKSISEIDNAFAVARSIKQKGIKAVRFMDKAAELATAFVAREMGEALTVDIINSLPDTLDGTDN